MFLPTLGLPIYFSELQKTHIILARPDNSIAAYL